MFISDCAITRNSSGIQVAPTSNGTAQVFLDRVQLESNAGSAIMAESPAATVRLNQSTLTNNGTGIALAGGSVISFGNNAISGNTTDGKPSATQPLQ